jgi:Flp pilus assembly protein TadG
MLGQLLRDRTAAAGAEMALVAPLLLAIMFGAMELGYYFYSEHVVIKAVRDGARFASREGFNKFDCSTRTIDPTVVTDTQRVTRTDRVASGGASRLPGWTDDTSVQVTMPPCDTSGTYSGVYQDLSGGVPVVIVTATVPYTSLFSLLGFNTTGLQLRASSEVPVMGA